ncbi:hypothetical protein CK203_021046 [Vitis vinifera]|uniref:Uncharacterized protein n=2 Tax=Vitis vinifera TaxID=29760 RepID=A0A438JWV7_VITVI|nr:hypothetical protein CK203_021046 [Vitis vinifera]
MELYVHGRLRPLILHFFHGVYTYHLSSRPSFQIFLSPITFSLSILSPYPYHARFPLTPTPAMGSTTMLLALFFLSLLTIVPKVQAAFTRDSATRSATRSVLISCVSPSSSSRALRSRAGSPRRRHVVRHALLRPGEQPRQSSPTAATSLGAAGSKSSIGGRLPGGRRRCGEDEGLVFGLGLRLGPVLSLVLGLDYEGFGLGFEFGAQAQAYAEDGAFDLSPFLLLP